MKAIVMNSKDNVATLFNEAHAGDKLECVSLRNKILDNIIVFQDIPEGHKVALSGIDKGGKIIKYGELMGYATLSIKKNEHVHIHNVKSSYKSKTKDNIEN